jgi:hypothetical protein
MNLQQKRTNNTINMLINSILEDFKYICETMNDEDNEYISFSTCGLIDSDLKITVSDVMIDNGVFKILIVGKYYNYSYIDEDTLIYEIQDELNQYIGKNKVVVEDWINTNNNRQW